MRRIKMLLILVFILMSLAPLKVNAKESREQLLESALINRYNSLLKKTTNKSYECESITSIKRLGGPNEFLPLFEVKVQILTFKGAHNPPYDIITVTIKDELKDFKIVKVEKKENVSYEEAEKACEQWDKKFEAHKEG